MKNNYFCVSEKLKFMPQHVRRDTFYLKKTHEYLAIIGELTNLHQELNSKFIDSIVHSLKIESRNSIKRIQKWYYYMRIEFVFVRVKL